MVYVALAEAVVLAVVVVAFTGLLRWKERACSRREDLMLDKMLHAVGRPWTPAPAEETKAEPVAQSWTWSPEQLPVLEWFADRQAEAV